MLLPENQQPVGSLRASGGRSYIFVHGFARGDLVLDYPVKTINVALVGRRYGCWVSGSTGDDALEKQPPEYGWKQNGYGQSVSIRGAKGDQTLIGVSGW